MLAAAERLWPWAVHAHAARVPGQCTCRTAPRRRSSRSCPMWCTGQPACSASHGQVTSPAHAARARICAHACMPMHAWRWRVATHLAVQHDSAQLFSALALNGYRLVAVLLLNFDGDAGRSIVTCLCSSRQMRQLAPHHRRSVCAWLRCCGARQCARAALGEGQHGWKRSSEVAAPALQSLIRRYGPDITQALSIAAMGDGHWPSRCRI